MSSSLKSLASRPEVFYAQVLRKGLCSWSAVTHAILENMKTLLTLSMLIFCLNGCSSSRKPYMMPYSDEGSLAPGAAYAAEGFTFRKEMPDRRDWKPWEFYYKHCSEAGSRAYYSKTSYDCAGPYY